MSYQPTGHGLALMIADSGATEADVVEDAQAADRDGGENRQDGQYRNGEYQDGEYQDGLLHISDACITLEFPAPDGQRSVLAWDPAEVDWRSWPEAMSA